MSHKQELQGQYSEGIRVKISEKYKPPPKINLPMTYTLRVSVNKQLASSMPPKYEFQLEKTVKERMKEWRSVRTMMLEERKIRLDKAREEMQQQQQQRKEEKELELKEQENSENFTTTACETNYNTLPVSNSVYSTSQSYCSNTDSMLMPMQASYGNILKPIPLQNEYYNSNKPADKSPFNISDFEADTSSPFDNMELKSINDLEELAQVLKIDDHNYYTNYQQTQSNSGLHSYSTNNHQYGYTNSNSNNTVYHPQTYNYNYNLPQTTQSFNVPSSSSYNYNTSPIVLDGGPSSSSSINESKKSQFRSVPDIVKALESELDNNTHIAATTKQQQQQHSDNIVILNNIIPVRPKSTDNNVKIKPKIVVDKLENPYYSLPKNLQELSNNISSMGFPLPRVARTCKEFGNDQKKVVEHLLGLTQLLDLGFSEKDASTALILCDNDRDKAIDSLVCTQ